MQECTFNNNVKINVICTEIWANDLANLLWPVVKIKGDVRILIYVGSQNTCSIIQAGYYFSNEFKINDQGLFKLWIIMLSNFII